MMSQQERKSEWLKPQEEKCVLVADQKKSTYQKDTILLNSEINMFYSLTTLHGILEIYVSLTFLEVLTELEFMLCSVTFSWTCLKAELCAQP